ncbi:hypothetical protein [Actinoplanes sp. NPDC049802]|uniref:hypothetical protein n=1 Tax=Actinoplanes sp. NPDC049802 TaxID=3154742 RepID=UPI0033EEEB71
MDLYRLLDRPDLPDWMRVRIEDRLTQPPIEAVRDLLQMYVNDSCGFDEIRRELRPVTGFETAFLRLQLDALERVLAEPQPKGTLLWLVELDANHGMDHDPTDRGAAVFLRQIADLVREALAEAEGELPGR